MEGVVISSDDEMEKAEKLPYSFFCLFSVKSMNRYKKRFWFIRYYSRLSHQCYKVKTHSSENLYQYLLAYKKAMMMMLTF